MASISTIEVKATMEGRPCVVFSGSELRKAICHLFSHGGQTRAPVAIVEFEDGTMDLVHPTRIRFLDTATEMEKYDWKTRPNTEGAE